MAPVDSGTDELLGESVVAQDSLRFERIEQVFDCFPAGTVRGELARKLAARMLASREQLQRPRPDFRIARDAVQASTAPAASSGMPLFVGSSNPRNAVSTASAMSPCSLRNSRTLSLPWPMRSPP